MWKRVYVQDINWNIVETEVRDEREERIKQLEEEIKSRQEEVERFKENAIKDMAEITELEEENKKLKFDIEARKEMKKARDEKIRFLEECLDRKEELNARYRKQIDTYKSDLICFDDVKAEYESQKKINKKLKKELSKYKKQYKHSLWDDELIYEEWLYD